jgi:glutaryl-CoA dehydrogenase
VEKGTKGFKAWDVHGKLSLRASITSGLSMSDCEIPAENVLPGVEGLRGPLSCLTAARYGIGWGAIGAAMACYDTALQYSKTRKQFANKPIASHQLVQDKLVFMITEISKAQLLALHVGRRKDMGKLDFTHVSMLKMNNVWMALETSRKAREILGANGIVDDYCIMRHMNNLESVYTYEGTHDIHRLIIGERITGVAAYF